MRSKSLWVLCLLPVFSGLFFGGCSRQVANPTFPPTHTFTPVNSFTATAISSNTGTFTATPVNSSTHTASPTATSSPTTTFTLTATTTSTITSTPTITNTVGGPTDTFTSTSTITDTPTWTSTLTITATPTLTATVTDTPTITSTSTATVSAATPCTELIENFETATENGSWAAVANCTLSYTTSHATLGSKALQADVTTGGGANLLAWTSFSPSAWTNVKQVVMDIYVDSSLVSGSYNQLSLVENSAAGGYWSSITDNADIVAGQQSVTFNIDWALGSVTGTTPMGKLLLVWNTNGTGTGNLSIDNIRLVGTTTACPPTVPSTCGLIENFESATENGSWAAVANCTLSYTTSHATLGSKALQADVTTGGGANLLAWTSFSPTTWTSVTQVIMDIYADSSLVSGSYNQLSLVENSAAGGYWSSITDNADIVAGQQSVTFNIDWALGSVTGTTPMGKLLLVWNTNGTGTGNLSIDNVRLKSGASCNP